MLTENYQYQELRTNALPCLDKWEGLAELITSLDTMKSYGKDLLEDGEDSCAQIVLDLIRTLTAKLQKLDQIQNASDLAEFKLDFYRTLHSKDEEMSDYRLNWETLTINIFIAFTGLGLALIVGNLIYTGVTYGRVLFFGQENQTTREKLIVETNEKLKCLMFK